MGFRMYVKRCTGTSMPKITFETGSEFTSQMMGVRKNQAKMTTSIICCTSRYNTLIDDKNRLTPSVKKNCTLITMGSIKAQAVSCTPNSNDNSTSIGSAIRKLTRFESRSASGSVSRGKYTFLIKEELLTTLAVPPIIDAEKKFQGSRPDRINTG